MSNVTMREIYANDLKNHINITYSAFDPDALNAMTKRDVVRGCKLALKG